MPWSLVLLLLAQTPASPGVAVVVSRRANISPERALELARQAEGALAASGVPVALGAAVASARLAELGEKAPETCQGESTCLARLGARLGVPIVVGIEVGQLDRDIALHLDATRVIQGTSGADQIILLNEADPRPAETLNREITPFAKAVAALLPEVVPPEPTPPPAPAPVAARPERIEPAPPVSPLRQWAWAPAAAGAALAGGSSLLLLQARSRYATLTAADVSGLHMSDAVRLAHEGESLQATGLTLAAAGAGALVVAGAMYWLGRPPERQPALSVTIAPGPGQVAVVASGSFP